MADEMIALHALLEKSSETKLSRENGWPNSAMVMELEIAGADRRRPRRAQLDR
jgi:hypothetical protein